MAKGIDTGSHPGRKVGREDYHTTNVAAAADFAQSHASSPRRDDPYLKNLAQSGRTMSPEERDAYYDD